MTNNIKTDLKNSGLFAGMDGAKQSRVAFIRKIVGAGALNEDYGGLGLCDTRLWHCEHFAGEDRQVAASRVAVWSAIHDELKLSDRMAPGGMASVLNYSVLVMALTPMLSELDDYLSWGDVFERTPRYAAQMRDGIMAVEQMWRCVKNGLRECPRGWLKNNVLQKEDRIRFAVFYSLWMDGTLPRYAERHADLWAVSGTCAENCGMMSDTELGIFLQEQTNRRRLCATVEQAMTELERSGLSTQDQPCDYPLPMLGGVEDYAVTLASGGDLMQALGKTAFGQYVCAKAKTWSKTTGMDVLWVAEMCVSGYALGLAHYTPVTFARISVSKAEKMRLHRDALPVWGAHAYDQHSDGTKLGVYTYPHPSGAVDARIQEAVLTEVSPLKARFRNSFASLDAPIGCNDASLADMYHMDNETPGANARTDREETADVWACRVVRGLDRMRRHPELASLVGVVTRAARASSAADLPADGELSGLYGDRALRFLTREDVMVIGFANRLLSAMSDWRRRVPDVSSLRADLRSYWLFARSCAETENVERLQACAGAGAMA